ncbi:putative [histone H3]-lysine(4) N-trimethyltransferase [Dioscorea sansibarensis]
MEEKGRKEMLLSSFHPAFKRRRNHLNVSLLKPNGFVSGVRRWENLENKSSALHNSSGLDENSQSLNNETTVQTSDKQEHQSLSSRGLVNSNGLGDSLVIPKRPRATTRRKKIDILNNLKRSTGHSTSIGKTRTDAPSSKSPISIFPSPHALNGDKKKMLDYKQNSCFSRDGSVPKIKDEKEKHIRKRKRLEIERKTHVEKEKLGDVEKLSGGPVEDDEDNLEQNAARMLSSRFDPSCTGFSGKKMALSLKSTKGCSPLKQFNGTLKSLCSETSSVSAAGRVLRPRNRNSKGFARKRRHFYEVCSKDMDPNSLIKQRIRVFWPLDQCWYFGLVKDYDPASKLHHVKYDDRDEEWIDLQNERFKLLLFPSEVSRSLNSRNLGLESKEETDQNDKDIINDNCIGNFMETEPIISWLARSSGSLKSSPERVLKKRRAHFLNNFRPSTLSRKMNVNAEPSTITPNKSNLSSAVPGNSLDGEIAGASLLNHVTRSDDRKLSFVYTRRRFRKRSSVLDGLPSQVSSCSNSAGSFHILASAMDTVTALEKCGLTITKVGLKQLSVKLLLPAQRIHDLSSELRTCWLSHADYGLHYGKLIQVSPVVHMEIIFVDNVLGLRVLSFEGCLQWLWSFVSLIVSAFHGQKHKKLADMLLPSTSIGFNVSGLHDRRRHIVFVLHSFLQLDKSRWEYLEYKLKHHCLKMMGLPIDSFFNSNLKNLPSSCEMISTTVMSDPTADKDVTERLCSRMNLFLNYFQQKNEKLPPHAFSFAESPYLFLGLHLKLLVHRNTTSLKPKKPSAMASKELPEIVVKSINDGCSPIENSPEGRSEKMLENLGCSLGASSSGWLDGSHPKGETDACLVSSDGNQMKSNRRSISCEEKHENACDSCLNDTSLHTQSYDQGKEQSNEDMQAACHASDMAWEMNALPVNVSKTTAPRSIWHHNQLPSISPNSWQRSRLWTEDFIWDSFASGSRKPRTQVSYSLSFGNREIGSRPRSHNRKARPFKKIRIDSEKSVLGSFHTYFASRICDANVLVTSGDRGWRECGAQVVLDSADQNGCRISVKFSGVTKYNHKVQQSLQPGSTNRFTHAMMWKGGKDWTLEFTDRNQWSLFKELHEECYNWNIRSACVKNIPTPGVRLIEDAYEGSSDVPFVRSSPKYFRQVGTEIDMALDPSCVLYDMDSEDEEWISEFRLSLDDSGNNGSTEVADDMFEGIMDMFEKSAYVHDCDEFTDDDIQEFIADGGPLNITKAIYEHWQHKRRKKGLPLIRQFQPPLWERYQQQLKQWESAMSIMHNSLDGSQGKGCSIEKPAMFAFCLRPRGLEVPNKFSKQRSHKKFMYSGHHNSFAKERDGLHAYDRKVNGTSAGGEKDLVIAIPTNESSDYFHSRHASSSFSPMDSRKMGFFMTNDASERSQFPVLYRNNSKKIGFLASPRDLQMLSSPHNQKIKRNSSSRWSADMSEWPSRIDSHLEEFHRHRADIDEFRLRDASSAAQHARNMAKLKREKAHRLLHKANLALHKATVALITAEAIKASQKSLIGDG